MRGLPDGGLTSGGQEFPCQRTPGKCSEREFLTLRTRSADTHLGDWDGSEQVRQLLDNLLRTESVRQ